MRGVKTDIVGLRYGRLLVIAYSHTDEKFRRYWECLCDCGAYKLVNTQCLNKGTTKSCGCIAKEFNKNKKTHGLTLKGKKAPPEYWAWANMKTRCYNKNEICYPNYGGRGIKVCNRWLKSFENFLSDMGNRPSKKHSLDRYPDVNGDYGPSNCRWATDIDQARCKRTNVRIEYRGIIFIQQDFVKIIGTDRTNLLRKLNNGESLEYIVDYFLNKKPNRDRITTE